MIMKLIALLLFSLACSTACSPDPEKVYEDTCDFLMRNQTGGECDGVVLHWGGREFRQGVMANETSSASLGADIPKTPRAELWFVESQSKELHKLPCDMGGLDRAAISKAKQCINVVFTLTKVKVIVGEKIMRHVELEDGK